ncbi:MAG: chitobiase/beta-hexosaminidase C-terminal domain-containing protein [Lachnospiraceae bacterium]|nr:chitobiase/beta-hexosaminidase C-terminal domain-containing protein [Lachnospiraceae bacterium]
MKCPNCGANLPDDKLICEKCGAEFQIVPNYDVNVEGEIYDTLKDIGGSGRSKREREYKDMEFDDNPNLLSMLINGRNGKGTYILLALIVVLVVVIIVVMGKRVSRQNSLEYQLEMANQLVSDNKLLSAVPYLEKAYKIDGKTEHLFKIADYYYSAGRINDAIYTLMEVADTDSSSVTDKETAYRKVVTLYEGASDYAGLADILKHCTLDSIKKDYAKYMVAPPVFNFEGGTYNETITLKITSSLPGGEIHFTKDAATPNENSEVFSSPLFLEYGNYTVNAVYVNAFGVSSEVVTQKYLIDVEFKFEPIILTDSGEYTKATQIKAEVPAAQTLYYTTDGTEPTKESNKYTGPIQMPYGKSTFKFVSFALDGSQSVVVTREYDFKYKSAATPEGCERYLVHKLYERGVLSELFEIDNITAGKKSGRSGYFKYVFTTAYPIEGQDDYFFLVEYNVDDMGNVYNTGDIYAMHVINGDKIYKVNKLGNDKYGLIDF